MEENKVRIEDEFGNIYYPHNKADVVFMSDGTTVEQHAGNKKNPHAVTKSQVGLGSVENYGVATQAEAEAGTANNKYMTPQRAKQAFNKNISPFSDSLEQLETQVTTHLDETSGKHIHSSGNNANGHWIKFDDGTLICYGSVSLIASANVDDDSTWTFPAAFINSDRRVFVAIASVSSSNAFEVKKLITNGFNLTDITVRLNATLSQIYVFSTYVIGRWKL